MPTSDRILREVRRFAATARPDHDSDRALLERFTGSRDERAFAELVRRHGPMVLGVCRRVLRHAADADDAFQAVFLILVRRASVLREPDRLGAWLFGVAWRTANKLRATRRPLCDLSDDVAVDTALPADWPVELDAAIARLPEKYRTPIVLCHLQGLSAAEAARRLGCPAATLTTRLFRARHSLRRRLSALGLAVPVALTTGSVVDVPAALASAALEMAAGGSISPAAVRLADGVFRSLYMTKIRWATVVAAVCLAGAGVFGFRAGGQDPVVGPVAPPPAQAAVAPPPVVPRGEEPATVKTANFRVTAPSQRIGRLIADAAERARKDAAMTWLGKELPVRTETCRITVKISPSGMGGSTTFNFDGEAVSADMQVEGTLDRILSDVIPHEVTHVVMAEYFRQPLPRWADEGIALLSESEEEGARHVRLAAQTANAGRLIQLKAFCTTRDYPKDLLGFYSQSYLLTRTLVDRQDRPTFLNFVGVGMVQGWEAAAKEFYGSTLDDLERDMLGKLKGSTKVDESATTGPTTQSAPVFAWARADNKGGVAVFEQVGSYYEPVTSYVRRDVPVKDSQATQTHVQPVTNYKLRAGGMSLRLFEPGQVRASFPDGKAIPEAELVEALKGKTVAVVLVADGKPIDPRFAALLKADAIVLAVPAPKAEAPKLPPPDMPPGR